MDEFACPNGYRIGVVGVSMKLNTLNFVNRVEKYMFVKLWGRGDSGMGECGKAGMVQCWMMGL